MELQVSPIIELLLAKSYLLCSSHTNIPRRNYYRYYTEYVNIKQNATMAQMRFAVVQVDRKIITFIFKSEDSLCRMHVYEKELMFFNTYASI